MSDPSLTERKKGPNGCVMAIIACVVLLLLLVCLVWIWKMRADRQLAKQLKAIEERGEPTTVEQADTFYTLKEGTFDATDMWTDATSLYAEKPYAADAEPFPIVGTADYEIPTAGESWPDLDDAEAFLNRYRDSINLMHAAAEVKGGARFHRDFSEGFMMNLDEVQQLRQGARMLQLNSHVHAHRGKPDEVAKSVQSMLRLSECIEREPFLVSQMVRTALLSVAARAAGDAMGESNLSDSQLAELQTAFDEIQLGEGFRRAMMGERFMVLQAMKTGVGDMMGTPSQLFHIIPQDTGTYLDLMERCINAMDEPFVEGTAELETLEEEVEALSGPRQMICKLTMPALSNVPAGRARGEAYAKMVVAAAGVKRFQLAEGRLPKDLAQLVPKYLDAVPLDPFDLKPIRYIPGDDGVAFTVYCIGKDGVDDGATGENDVLDHALNVGTKVEWVEEEEEEEVEDATDDYGAIERELNGQSQEEAEEAIE